MSIGVVVSRSGCSARAVAKSSTVGPTGMSRGAPSTASTSVGTQGSLRNQPPRVKSMPAPADGLLCSTPSQIPPTTPSQPSGTVNRSRIVLLHLGVGCSGSPNPHSIQVSLRSGPIKYVPGANWPRCSATGDAVGLGVGLGAALGLGPPALSAGGRSRIPTTARATTAAAARPTRTMLLFMAGCLRAGHQARRCRVTWISSRAARSARSDMTVGPSSSQSRAVRSNSFSVMPSAPARLAPTLGRRPRGPRASSTLRSEAST